MTYQAFFSYARVDNMYSDEGISILKELIEKEVRIQSGQKDFKIFRDVDHIEPGNDFKITISNAIKDAVILIPIITPSYFESTSCIQELEDFQAKQNESSRIDLIVPIYFHQSADMDGDPNDPTRPRKYKQAARFFNQRQFTDLRKFYRKGLVDKNGIAHQEVKDAVETLGKTIATSLRIFNKQKLENVKLQGPLKTIKSIPWPNGVFSERIQHYQGEKEHLAKYFGRYLLERIQAFCSSATPHEVILFIDSGSTLYNFFNIFGEIAKQDQANTSRSWTRNLTIISNNLGGISWLMQEGRSSSHKFADVAINCVLLPGEPSPTYHATIPSLMGSFSNSNLLEPLSPSYAIKQLGSKVKQSKNRVKIITLLSGNWIRIRERTPKIAIPLSRGAKQIEVKQALVDVSDEIYLVAPLGKVFAGHKKDEVRSTLQHTFYKDGNSNLYEDIKHFENKIRLISTYRNAGSLLENLSNKLAEDDFIDAQKIENSRFVEKMYSFRELEFKNVANYMFEFSPPHNSPKNQLDFEFPHPKSHTWEFVSKFHVPKLMYESFEKPFYLP